MNESLSSQPDPLLGAISRVLAWIAGAHSGYFAGWFEVADLEGRMFAYRQLLGFGCCTSSDRMIDLCQLG